MNKLILVFLLVPQLVFAAPRSQNVREQVKSLLSKGRTEASSHMRYLGAKEAQESLRSLAFDESQKLQTRWRAIMHYTHLTGEKSVPVLKKAMLDKAWFMRSAGLTALTEINAKAAKKWAYQMLDKDSALMVRMKAFEVLKTSKNHKIRKLFWKKLFSQDSFHNNKSLWIRDDLALKLAEAPTQKELSLWVRLLHDKEHRFQKVASDALAKITKRGPADEVSLSYWKKRFPTSRNL